MYFNEIHFSMKSFHYHFYMLFNSLLFNLTILSIQYSILLVTERNATDGHIIYADGLQKHMIDALSQMLNFR